MEDLGLYLISILLLLVFVILLIWLLFRVGQIIRLIRAGREEKVDQSWCQAQLSKFTDEEFKQLLTKLELDE